MGLDGHFVPLIFLKDAEVFDLHLLVVIKNAESILLSPFVLTKLFHQNLVVELVLLNLSLLRIDLQGVI